MKLTKTQSRIMARIETEIQQARSCETIEEYFTKYVACRVNSAYNTSEKYKAGYLNGWNNQIEWWQQKKSGIVCINEDSRSIKALERLGLIEIISDGGLSPDLVKLVE